MKEFKISAQQHILDDILEHLSNGMMGQAIARDWDYELKNNIIFFTLKEGHEVQLDVIFWFGYLTKD